MSTSKITKLEPARTVLALFDTPEASGVKIVSDGLGLAPSTVFRWQYPKCKHGTGGRVPGAHYDGLKDLAAQQGVDLPWEILTGRAFRDAAFLAVA